MLDEVLRKARYETELLGLVAAFSLTASAFLIADAMIGLVLEQYSLALVVLRVFELVFAIAWLVLSASMTSKIFWLRTVNYRLAFLRKPEQLDEAQRKSETADLIRIMVGFYRDNYLKFTAIVALALSVSFSIIAIVTYLMVIGAMSFWVAVGRWTVGSSMLLVTSVLCVYVHNGWRGKLVKVKDAEKRLSEMLGGPIEA